MIDQESCRKDVIDLKKAVFGDQGNRNDLGILGELEKLEDRQRQTNDILVEIKSDNKKLFWLVLTLVVAAILNSVVGKLLGA